jgi:CheY-like chemotaxis protein
VDSLSHANAEILIVDDEPNVIRFLSRALQSVGYKSPHGFTNPLEACSYLDVADPDLITLDTCMPGLDDYGLCEALAKHSPNVPPRPCHCALMTSKPARKLSKPAKDFLVKPVAVNEFLLHVYLLLDTRFLERRLRAVSLLRAGERPPSSGAPTGDD